MNANPFTRNRAPSRIIRLVGLNALGGASLGGASLGGARVGLLTLSDFAGLAIPIGAGRELGAALGLLLGGGFTATFASLVAATAAMLIPERGHDCNPGQLVPVPVRARAPYRCRP